MASGVCERSVEPLVERSDGFEDGWQDEIEQCPQFGQAVLEWCTSQDKTEACVVVLCDGTAQFGVGVLHAVTFVDDHVQPLDFTQDRSVLDDKLVRGEENLELPVADLLRVVLTLVRRSLVHDARDRWRPLFELVVPVRQGTERHDDQEGARLLLLLNEVRDE